MKSITYQIQFFSYWHTSSGLSAGTEASLSVMKDENQLPYIPGKTLKGLLREAATQIKLTNTNLIKDDFIEKIFGVGDDVVKKHKEEKPNEPELKNSEGCCYFSNAELSTGLMESIKTPSLLYDTITSTAIDEKGQALDHSLRSMQVAIPLTLYAKVLDLPEEEGFKEQLEYCFKWIKRMGVNRNKGLGRCEFSIYQN